IAISIYVEVCSGVEEYDANDFVSISPNPASTELTIGSIQSVIKSAEVFDMLGHRLSAQNQEAGTKNQVLVDVSSIPAGIYFVKVKTEHGLVMRKILIER